MPSLDKNNKNSLESYETQQKKPIENYLNYPCLTCYHGWGGAGMGAIHTCHETCKLLKTYIREKEKVGLKPTY